MGCSPPPPPPKAGVSDFCNIVSQGFPGQHARTVFVTPSGCLAAGRGQDGACSSPDTLLRSLAPCCPPGRLPAFREDRPWPGPGKGQGGWWARSGLHRHCPHPDPPQNASDPPPVAAPASSPSLGLWGAAGAIWGWPRPQAAFPGPPHLIKKQLAVPATPLSLSRLPQPCPCVARHTWG